MNLFGLKLARPQTGNTLRFIGMLVVVFFTLFPFLVVVGTSLKTMSEVFRSPATLIPEVVVWYYFFCYTGK